MPDPPVADALVVPSSRAQAQHPTRVADGQGADPAGHRPADHCSGRFMLGLADPAGVPHLGQPQPTPVAAPPS